MDDLAEMLPLRVSLGKLLHLFRFPSCKWGSVVQFCNGGGSVRLNSVSLGKNLGAPWTWMVLGKYRTNKKQLLVRMLWREAVTAGRPSSISESPIRCA